MSIEVRNRIKSIILLFKNGIYSFDDLKARLVVEIKNNANSVDEYKAYTDYAMNLIKKGV